MKLKNLFQAFFCILTLSLFLVSCEWKTIVKPEVEIPEEVSFATDIEPIFADAGCTACHDSPGGPASLNLTAGNAFNSIIDGNFVNTANPEESLIYSVPLSSGTHFAKYSDGEAALILKWIQDGAQNN